MRRQWWVVVTALAVGSVAAGGAATPTFGVMGPVGAPRATHQHVDSWVSTAPMSHKRAEPMIVRLHSGRVLVAGAGDSSLSTMPCTASVEIYHPARDHWTSAASLPKPLCGASATVLRNGRVLVAGGFVRPRLEARTTRAAYLYRPGRDEWSRTGSMRRSRAYFAMAPLPGGRVLVAGGRVEWSGQPLRRSAEIYNPKTGTWHMTDPLHDRRTAQSSVVLETRDVLVAGGYRATAERFDVRRQRWERAGELREWVFIDPSLVVQRGGNVLAIGDGAKVDQYVTEQNVWRRFPRLPLRVQGESALRADHRPVVIGGMSRNTFSARCFARHSGQHRWQLDSRMPVAKALFGAVRLGGGSVLVVGGEVRHSEGISYYTRTTARLSLVDQPALEVMARSRRMLTASALGRPDGMQP